MSKWLFLFVLALAGFFLASCGVERYPLVIKRGKTYLETRDRGQVIYFLVDTGSNRSFLSAKWVSRAGGRLEPGPPDAWYGVNIGDSGHKVASGLPSFEGVPPVLNGLSAMEGGPSSALAESIPVAGLLGTDLFWDWSIDFRAETAYLVHGSVTESSDPERIRYDLFQDGGHYTIPINWTQDPTDNASPSVVTDHSIVDTGSPFPVSYFHESPLYGLDRVINPRSPLSANGTVTTLARAKGFRVGTFLIPPVIVVAGKIVSGPMTLIGTPALWSSRAVLSLKDWTLSFGRELRPLPVSQISPEAWAWKATLVPGEGVRVDEVIPGSTLDRRGLKSGDITPWMGTERADQPRSVLEWRRAWIAFAVQKP